MNKIQFNNSQFTLESYNKSTNFSGENITSTAYCTVVGNDITALITIAQEEITSLQIIHDDEVIYSLQDISAHIDSINEYLTDNRVVVNVNMTFSI